MRYSTCSFIASSLGENLGVECLARFYPVDDKGITVHVAYIEHTGNPRSCSYHVNGCSVMADKVKVHFRLRYS